MKLYFIKPPLLLAFSLIVPSRHIPAGTQSKACFVTPNEILDAGRGIDPEITRGIVRDKSALKEAAVKGRSVPMTIPVDGIVELY